MPWVKGDAVKWKRVRTGWYSKKVGWDVFRYVAVEGAVVCDISPNRLVQRRWDWQVSNSNTDKPGAFSVMGWARTVNGAKKAASDAASLLLARDLNSPG